MGLDFCVCTYRVKMGQSPLNVAEWEAVLGKMLRYHDNISKEIGTMVIEIKTQMKSELVPVAEDRANYGKIVKAAIRSMWALEYEIEDIQLQSKPLQVVLMGIRNRQKATMDDIKKTYDEKIGGLEALVIKRPPKPAPKPAPAPAPAEGEKKEEAPAAALAEPAPAVDAAAAPAPVAASA